MRWVAAPPGTCSLDAPPANSRTPRTLSQPAPPAAKPPRVCADQQRRYRWADAESATKDGEVWLFRGVKRVEDCCQVGVG